MAFYDAATQQGLFGSACPPADTGRNGDPRRGTIISRYLAEAEISAGLQSAQGFSAARIGDLTPVDGNGLGVFLASCIVRHYISQSLRPPVALITTAGRLIIASLFCFSNTRILPKDSDTIILCTPSLSHMPQTLFLIRFRLKTTIYRHHGLFESPPR